MTSGFHNAVLWLGAPEGARFFAADALSAGDLQRFRESRSARRREEFAVSRALREHARSAVLPTESISHSARHCALLQAQTGLRVGVDLEAHRPRDFLSIARATFATSEAAALGNLSGSDREQAFYALWTLKEALAKALQLNLFDALRDCEFPIAARRWSARVPTDRSGSFWVFRPRPDLTLAAVLIGDDPAGPMRTLEWPGAQRPWPLVTAGVVIPRNAVAPRPADP